jgi:selenide,water dikinase
MQDEKIALTKYSHGGGCGCKIAPQVLMEILHSEATEEENSKLLVGNKSNDDAAVYDLGDGRAMIATADFFMPIVDDPFDFGRVAAANAISDVYAMGGTPTLALALLGWPIAKLTPAVAQKVIEGARATCRLAGIPLAGGHSIDTMEPMFGLSVNGLIELKNLKRNDTAREGDVLFLTKALGTGMLSTARKRGVLRDEDGETLLLQLIALNSIGEQLGKIGGVHSMTDVTGFGILGHSMEMARGSGLTVSLNYSALPRLKGVEHYVQLNTVPDATSRNWNAYHNDVYFEEGINMAEAFVLMPDPQTNGGLLVAVAEEDAPLVARLLNDNDLGDFSAPVGRIEKKGEKWVRVLK